MSTFTIKCWSVCFSETLFTSTDTEFSVSTVKIPPLIKRRLTPLGRMSFAAVEALDTPEPAPFIFASRHGDASRTLDILQGQATDEPISPTAFSLSVHNAFSGLLSIYRKDTSIVTAIAASEHLLLSALIEAVALLEEHPEVICLLCDAPAPAFYEYDGPDSVEPWVVAIRISKEGGEQRYQLNPSTTEPSNGSNSAVQAADILRFLKSEQHRLVLGSPSAPWLLSRVK